MEKLFAIKDEKHEFYAQIQVTKNIWKFLDKIALNLFYENSMIDDHYRGELKTSDYFSFEKDGIIIMIIMTKERAHIIILNPPNHKEIKEILNKQYTFDPTN